MDARLFFLTFLHFSVQPGLGKAPMTFDCRGCHTHHVSRFFNRKAAEVTQFNHARLLFVKSGQSFERIVERDQFGAALDRPIDVFIKGELLKILAALFRVVFARVIHQQATHYLGGNSEKMRPVLPVYPRLIHQA